MNFEELRESVMSKTKGGFCNVVWEKEIPVSKSVNNISIKKRSSGVMRFGVIYDNIRSVVDKRESGELPSVNQGLPWGEWIIPNYFIGHKGKTYIRCSLVNNNKLKTEYILNGKPVSEGVVRKFCNERYLKSHDDNNVLTIGTENIVSVK